MARTAMAAQAVPGPYATAPVLLTMANADNTNGNSTPLTGKEQILVNNTTGGAVTLAVTSSTIGEPFARTGDIAAFSIATLRLAVTQVFPQNGWLQADGNLYWNVNTASVPCAVLKHV